MAPFHAASTRRVQNRCPADVDDKTQGTPLGKEEASSCQVILIEEQQPDSTTKPDVKPKGIAVTTPASTPAVMEPALQELPVPRALQAFFRWVNGMMRYIPESNQVWAVNATKSTICDMLSETMASTAVPPGMEAGFAQLVMTTAALPPEDKDTCVVQFMDESEGGCQPWATAVQQSWERMPHQSRELCRSWSWDPDSCAYQEALDQVRRDATKDKPKLKSVVKKPDLPATPAASPAKGTSPNKRDWDKRTKKEWLATCDQKRARNIAAGNRKYARLMEERWWLAKESSAVKSLFSDTTEDVAQLRQEPSIPIPGVPEPAPDVPEPAPAVKEELQRGGIACDQPSDDDDSLDEGIPDEGRQLTPIDDLASPEDSYFLEFECTGGQAEKMALSPPRPQEVEFTFIKPTVPRPVTPVPMEPITPLMEAKPDYQLMPKGTSLIEQLLTQLYVCVHYKINKLPVPEWGAELSQLRPAEVKKFQAWCLWAGNWRQKYGDWAAIPVIESLWPECYGLEGSTRPLAKLTLVLGLDGALMSLLQVVIQAQILTEAGDKPPGKGKVMAAVQWVMSTLGEDQLPFKATAAMFGCIPDYREPSPGLDSTVLTEFKGSAMESDVLSAGDLGQDTDRSDTETSYVSATEVDIERNM